jgi:hypothetical protein
MQLDRTLVTIRARNNFDLLDLTSVLCREYFSRFALLTIVSWLPWILIDVAILYPIAFADPRNFESIWIAETFWYHVRFIYLASALIFLQAPLAMLPLTFSLGQQMFGQTPSAKDIWQSERRLVFLKLMQLGFRRCSVPGMILIGISTYSIDVQPLIEFLVLPIFLLVAAFLRATRPFAPEVISLEQGMSTVDSKGSETRKKYSGRMKSLHQLMSSEFVGRFMSMSVILIALTIIFTTTEIWIFQMMQFFQSWNWVVTAIFVPFNLVVLSTFTTVYRFLSYIDSRILLEGWEIQLRFFTEANRFRNE